MKMIKKLADNFEGYCCAVMLAAMSVVVFLQVIFRFIIKASLPWSEELSRYLLVYITYFGCAYGIKSGAHLGVEAFVLILPKKLQRFLNILVQLGGMVVCLLILKFGADIVASQMQSGQLSPAMRLPMWTIYSAIPIGMAFCVIRYIGEIIKAVKAFIRPETAETEG